MVGNKVSNWKLNVVLDKRKLFNDCMEFLRLTDAEQGQDLSIPASSKPGMTMDIKELLAIGLTYALAIVFAYQGRTIESLAIAGPVTGYAIGKSNPR